MFPTILSLDSAEIPFVSPKAAGRSNDRPDTDSSLIKKLRKLN